MEITAEQHALECREHFLVSLQKMICKLYCFDHPQTGNIHILKIYAKCRSSTRTCIVLARFVPL